jgi:hypothetical protein
MILIPFVLVVLALTELDNRNFLYRNFSDDDLKGYHSPFFPLLACVILFFVLMFLFPSHNKEYNELKEKYDDLSLQVELYDEIKEEYDSLSSSVEKAYDKANTVKGYFLGLEEAPYEYAKQSMQELYDLLYPGEW